MKKLILVAATVATLAVPAAASASQPVNPGGFGKERAANIQTYFTNDGLGNWGQWSDGAAARAADNSDNTTWMQEHSNSLPAESNAGLKPLPQWHFKGGQFLRLTALCRSGL